MAATVIRKDISLARTLVVASPEVQALANNPERQARAVDKCVLPKSANRRPMNAEADTLKQLPNARPENLNRVMTANVQQLQPQPEL